MRMCHPDESEGGPFMGAVAPITTDLGKIHTKLSEVSRCLSMRQKAIRDIVEDDEEQQELHRLFKEVEGEIAYNLLLISGILCARQEGEEGTAQLASFMKSQIGLDENMLAWEAEHPCETMKRLRERSGVPHPKSKDSDPPAQGLGDKTVEVSVPPAPGLGDETVEVCAPRLADGTCWPCRHCYG